VNKLFLLLLISGIAFGQATTGYHRVNQLLSRGTSGVTAQIVPNGTIFVTNTTTGAVATIYSDPGLSVPITSGVVTSDKNGNYDYYIPLNYCVDEQVSAAGQGSYTTKNICVNSSGGSALPASAPLIGTTSGGSAQSITLGSNLSLSGTTLNATGGGSAPAPPANCIQLANTAATALACDPEFAENPITHTLTLGTGADSCTGANCITLANGNGTFGGTVEAPIALHGQINATFTASQYSGGSVAAQIAAALSACVANGSGTVIVPPTMGVGYWTPPLPTGCNVIDQRNGIFDIHRTSGTNLAGQSGGFGVFINEGAPISTNPAANNPVGFYSEVWSRTLFGAITPGTGYTTASGLSTTGGTGTGLTVNITATSGGIISATVATDGTGYTPGDVVTVTQSGASGGTIALITVPMTAWGANPLVACKSTSAVFPCWAAENDVSNQTSGMSGYGSNSVITSYSGFSAAQPSQLGDSAFYANGVYARWSTGLKIKAASFQWIGNQSYEPASGSAQTTYPPPGFNFTGAITGSASPQQLSVTQTAGNSLSYAGTNSYVTCDPLGNPETVLITALNSSNVVGTFLNNHASGTSCYFFDAQFGFNAYNAIFQYSPIVLGSIKQTALYGAASPNIAVYDNAGILQEPIRVDNSNTFILTTMGNGLSVRNRTNNSGIIQTTKEDGTVAWNTFSTGNPQWTTYGPSVPTGNNIGACYGLDTSNKDGACFDFSNVAGTGSSSNFGYLAIQGASPAISWFADQHVSIGNRLVINGDFSNANGVTIPSTATASKGTLSGGPVLVLTCTTGSITPATTAGGTASGTCTVSASATGHAGAATASDGTVQGIVIPQVSVIGTTATVTLTTVIAGSPTAKTYNVTVF